MTTLDELRGRATCTVEEAAAVLEVGRATAYEAARQGQLPTLRLGRRVLVPVPKLLALLGADQAPVESAGAGDGNDGSESPAEIVRLGAG
jgi:excisionase family DNA binding protein